MKIALCHYRVAETDGVSLEMEKWKSVLEEQGHDLVYIAGSGNKHENCIVIPELHYQSPENNQILQKSYQDLAGTSPDELEQQVESLALTIEAKLIDAITAHKIDVLVPNNILSLGWGLPAGLAFARAIEKTDVKCVCHHHDWYYERELYSAPTTDYVTNLLRDYFPPHNDKISHVVISTLAQEELYKRKQIESTVVPNVFDMNHPISTKDHYNENFRAELGIRENDIVFLQATRIVERKAIELAIDVIAKIHSNPGLMAHLASWTNDSGKPFSDGGRIVFLLAGMSDGREHYLDKIIARAKGLGVSVVVAGHNIDFERRIEYTNSTEGTTGNERKIYSLWDAYLFSDVVTYTSLLEGWGNQFIEAVVAKLPILQFDYPVYKTDIKPLGFRTHSLGDSYNVDDDSLAFIDAGVSQTAAEEIVASLIDKDVRQSMVEHNYQVATKHLSLQILKALLSDIFSGKNSEKISVYE